MTLGPNYWGWRSRLCLVRGTALGAQLALVSTTPGTCEESVYVHDGLKKGPVGEQFVVS